MGYPSTWGPPYIRVPRYMGMHLQTLVPQYLGMHPHIPGYSSIWGCIPIYWGIPVFGDQSPYARVPRYIGMHPRILGCPRVGYPSILGCIPISLYFGMNPICWGISCTHNVLETARTEPTVIPAHILHSRSRRAARHENPFKCRNTFRNLT